MQALILPIEAPNAPPTAAPLTTRLTHRLSIPIPIHGRRQDHPKQGSLCNRFSYNLSNRLLDNLKRIALYCTDKIVAEYENKSTKSAWLIMEFSSHWSIACEQNCSRGVLKRRLHSIELWIYTKSLSSTKRRDLWSWVSYSTATLAYAACETLSPQPGLHSEIEGQTLYSN